MRGISSLVLAVLKEYGAARAVRQGAGFTVIARSASDEAIQLAFLTLDCFASARNDEETLLLPSSYPPSSCPAKAGYPVRRGGYAQSQTQVEYWITRFHG
jgi:hypothetical protein